MKIQISLEIPEGELSGNDETFLKSELFGCVVRCSFCCSLSWLVCAYLIPSVRLVNLFMHSMTNIFTHR